MISDLVPIILSIVGPGGLAIEIARRDRRTTRRDATAVRVARVAADAATEAAASTRPINNGFAARTSGDLRTLLDQMAEQARASARIEQRQIEQAAISGRTVARLDHTIARLDAHLDPTGPHEEAKR